MGIYEAWRNDFVFAVDNSNIVGDVNILANLGDTTIRDQNVGVSENNNIVLPIMLEDSAILKK